MTGTASAPNSAVAETGVEHRAFVVGFALQRTVAEPLSG
jgi:hypothetical protein